MKKEWTKAIATVLVVTMTVSTIAACGRTLKNHAEPADSLIASETFVPATVQEVEDDELTALIEDAIGGEWDGDFGALTAEQRASVQKKLNEKGYKATVSENGVVYYSYTPTADKEEITEAVRKALEDETWSGSFTDLSDEQKIAVRDELRERGYDVEIGEKQFEFLGEADRKEQTTSYYYERLPTQEQIIGAVGDVIGSSAALKWDGDLLSLTEQQRKDVLKKLNDFGFDLAINEQGELYMVHNPANKTTYKTAYTPMEVNGTTQEPTTVETTTSSQPTEPPEHMTGTAAGKTISAPNAERTALSTFGGTGGDTFQHVIASDDGGYIVTAQFRSSNGDYADADKTWQEEKSAVIKYDKNGSIKWKAMLGGKDLLARSGVFLYQSAELSNGSVVAVGNTDARNLGVTDMTGDALMVCYDASGGQKWIKRFAGSSQELFQSVCATPDGGFVAGGYTKSSDGDFDGLAAESTKAFLVKFSADGTKEWMQSFNSGTLAAQFKAIAVTDAGSIYAACYCPAVLGSKMQLDMLQYMGYGSGDSVIFKFDASGTLLTHRTVAGSGDDMVNCLAVADGGVIVGGRFTDNVRSDSVFTGKHNYGGLDAFLIRMDANLRVEWIKTFGGVGNEEITGVTRIIGGFAAVGSSGSTDGAFSFLGSGDTDAFVLTVSENGTNVQKYALNGTKVDHANGVVSRDGRQFAVVGETLSSTNMFSGLTPASTGKGYVSYFALYRVN